MDNMIMHDSNFTHAVGNYNRLFPQSGQVFVLGYIPHKTSMVDWSFDTFNFSLILSGRGIYQHGNNEPIDVKAPCVLTQWPRETMNYGPYDGEGWEELFLIYQPDQMEFLQHSGLYNPDRSWWPVQRKGEFRQAAESLIRTALQPLDPGIVDIIDRQAQMAVLQSLLPQWEKPEGKKLVIQHIKELVENHCTENFDFDDLAVQNGLSPSFFRKLWKERVGMSPQSYVMEKRMERARSMLLQTELEIGQIAVQAGYQDPLYFSRIFSKVHGISAREYRRTISAK